MSADTQADKARIDLSSYQVSLDGHRVRLERQPLDLLIFLVQHKGQLVTRGEIEEKLWGEDVFVDVDGSINAAVRKIRSALRDDPVNPKYLETVVGKGYRFTGEVELVSATSAMPISGTGSDDSTILPPGRWGGRRVALASVSLILLLAVAAWGVFRWRQLHASEPRPTCPVVAACFLA